MKEGVSSIDPSKRAMNEIDQRFLRYIVFTDDATDEMKARSRSHDDVILVPTSESPYDAPEIKGIHGIYHSIAFKDDQGQIRLKTRPFNCFCTNCSSLQFESCAFTDQFGKYEDRLVSRTPKTRTAVSVETKNDKLEKFRLFLCDESMKKSVLVAVINHTRDDSGSSFSMALLCKLPWESYKSIPRN